MGSHPPRHLSSRILLSMADVHNVPPLATKSLIADSAPSTKYCPSCPGAFHVNHIISYSDRSMPLKLVALPGSPLLLGFGLITTVLKLKVFPSRFVNPASSGGSVVRVSPTTTRTLKTLVGTIFTEEITSPKRCGCVCISAMTFSNSRRPRAREKLAPSKLGCSKRITRQPVAGKFGPLITLTDDTTLSRPMSRVWLTFLSTTPFDP